MASSFEPLFGGGDAAQAAPASWIDALSSRAGFSTDSRFGLSPADADLLAREQAQAEQDAALAEVIAEAEQRGREAALAEMEAEGQIARTLALKLKRMDDSMQEQLSTRLAETVCALCEATLAPMALDPDALQKRCVDAASLVGEGIIDASLRLHPDDIALLDPGFAATWHIVGDAGLERGSVQFDMAEGAVRDGPAQWRLALREALGLS